MGCLVIPVELIWFSLACQFVFCAVSFDDDPDFAELGVGLSGKDLRRDMRRHTHGQGKICGFSSCSCCLYAT